VIRYLTLQGRTMFDEYLGHWGRDVAQRDLRVLRYEQLLNETRFEPGTYIFTTFDEMHGPMARYVDALADALRESPNVRILNDPARVLKRFDLHDALWRAGRNAFRSFRANGDWSAARYPVFVRAEDDHQGAFSPLLHSAEEVDIWIGRAAALGHAIDHLLVIEFCDTADSDGFYRKYAAFNVGGRIVARSLSYGRAWMLKFGGNDFAMASALEELAYVQENPHAEELREIFAIAKIDYGRIDYAMLDGRVQTWEININPTVGRGNRPSRHAIPGEVAEVRETSKRTFYEHFNPAWLSMECGGPASAFTVRVDPLILQRAREERRRRWRTRSGILEHCIRLAKPLLKTPLAPVVRALYRGPQRVVRASAAPLFRLLGRRARTRNNASA
jgi:hypothetical protein